MASLDVHEQTQAFLEQFVNQTLRILVDDDRIFVGQFKCTDKELNIILSLTHEYRPPEDLKEQAQQSANSIAQVPYTSRFVGLVVVPGCCIKRIELERYNGNGLSDPQPFKLLPPFG